MEVSTSGCRYHMTENMSVSLETYNELKRRIMELHYPPGEILLIQQLITDLNVSRTPVKEALIRLAADGFLEKNDGKRFRVKDVDLQTIAEVFETRRALEMVVVEHLAVAISKQQLRELKKTIADTEKASKCKDALGVLRLDELFHSQLVAIHGNETLARVFEQLNERTQRILLMCHSSRHIKAAAAEQRRIYDALAEKNGARAREEISKHLLGVCEDLLGVLSRKRGPVYSGNLSVKREK